MSPGLYRPIGLLGYTDRVQVGLDSFHVRVHVLVRGISCLFHRPHKASCLFLLSETADDSEEVANGLLCCLYVDD